MTKKQVSVQRFSVTSSFLASYGSAEAMKVAQDLDSKVEAPLTATAT